jgi:hypothetical protein
MLTLGQRRAHFPSTSLIQDNLMSLKIFLKYNYLILQKSTADNKIFVGYVGHALFDGRNVGAIN